MSSESKAREFWLFKPTMDSKDPRSGNNEDIFSWMVHDYEAQNENLYGHARHAYIHVREVLPPTKEREGMIEEAAKNYVDEYMPAPGFDEDEQSDGIFYFKAGARWADENNPRIQQFELDNNELSAKLNFAFGSCQRWAKDYEQLEKENGNLKEENKKLSDEVFKLTSYYSEIMTLYNWKKEDCNKLETEIKELKKENAELLKVREELLHRLG